MSRIFRITNLFSILFICYYIIAGNLAEEILSVGVFHSDEVSAVDGEEWDILYSKDNRFFLDKTIIQLTIVEDVVIDNPGEKTGKEISLNIDGEPVLLLKNISDLSHGEVTTSVNKQLHFFNDDPIKARTDHFEYTIRMNIFDSKAELSISDGKTTQILKKFTAYKTEESYYYFGDEASPSLIWAGDLDGDNKLDLLLDMTDHYNVSEIVLFLSSHASSGKLVKKVAAFRTVGC